MKKYLLFFLLFLPAFLSAQDSVYFMKQWLKVYPYAHEEAYEEGDNRSLGSQLMIPLGTIPDGLYVQFIAPRREYKGDLITEVEEKKSDPVPYAIFQVQNGKLNGPAVFLNWEGKKIIEKGTYANNLKQGTWYWGRGMKNYYTFKDGILHGETLEYNHGSFTRRGDFSRTIYRDGESIASVWSIKYMGVGADRTLNEQKKLAPGEGPPGAEGTFRSYTNGHLVTEAYLDGKGDYVDTCRFYDSKTGKLTGLFFFPGVVTETDLLFGFWARNLKFDNKSEKDIYLDGISRYHENYGWPLWMGEYSDNRTYAVYGSGEQYYPNGRLQIRYRGDSTGVVMDTLFHENGRPKYVVVSDSSSQEFVAVYFNKKGEQYKELRESWFPEEMIIPEDVIYYRGLKLGKVSWGHYKYTHQPDVDEIKNASSDTVYTFLEVLYDRLIEETYYLPATRTRVHRMAFRSSGEPFYGTEMRYVFNEEYSAAQVTIQTLYDKRYKVISTFDAEWSEAPGVPANFILYERETVSDAYPVYNYRKEEDHLVSLTNYVDPFQTISNSETTYYLDDKPMSGLIHMKVNATHPGKIQANQKKIKFRHRDYSHYDEVFPFRITNRSGLFQTINDIWLLPDLFASVPQFDPMMQYGAFSGSHWARRTDYLAGATKISGQMSDGKLHGDWVVKDDRGETLATMSFNNGRPSGEFRFYHDREYRNTERYMYQHIVFENGLAKQMGIYNTWKDTVFFIKYKNGQPEDITYYQFREIEYQRPELAFIYHGHFEDAELVEVRAAQVKDGVRKYFSPIPCVNEMPDGLVIFSSDSGYFENGFYTGVTTHYAGHNKENKVYVKNNLIYKKECISPDQNLLWRMSFDTVTYPTYEYGISVYASFPWMRFPNTVNDTMPSEVKAHFENWYADGGKHSEGELIPGTRQNYYINIKTGTWNYYGTDGRLLTRVVNTQPRAQYYLTIDGIAYYVNDEGKIIAQPDTSTLDFMVVEGNTFYSKGFLSQFRNDSLLYEAEIIDYLQQYDCMSDQDYEVRLLYVLRDYLTDGTTVEKPTRYHRNYYDFGVLQSEGNLVNGMPHGLWQFYDSQGGLMSIGQLSNGKRHGTWFSGDLTGLNFLGEYCLNPDATNLENDFSELQKSVDLTIAVYDNGTEISSVKLTATRN